MVLTHRTRQSQVQEQEFCYCVARCDHFHIEALSTQGIVVARIWSEMWRDVPERHANKTDKPSLLLGYGFGLGY